MKAFRLILIIFLLIAAVVGVSAQRREIIEAVLEDVNGGSLVDQVYSNSRFGFSLKVPEGWNVMKQEEVAKTTAIGVELIKSKDEKVNRAIDKNLTSEKALITASRFPIGTPANSMLMVSIAKQANPRITSRMVMDASIKALTANPNIKLAGPVEVRKIAGRPFLFAEIIMYLNGVLMRSRMYQSTKDSYSLTIGYTYLREEDTPAFDEVLQSVKFIR